VANDMYHQRLVHAVRVLHDVKRLHRPFDMMTWYHRSIFFRVKACAAGWCAMDPWFQSQGLFLGTRDSNPWRYTLAYIPLKEHRLPEDPTHFYEHDAVKRFFGEDSQCLFYNPYHMHGSIERQRVAGFVTATVDTVLKEFEAYIDRTYPVPLVFEAAPHVSK